MRRGTRLVLAIALVLLLWQAVPGRAVACPNCKEAVAAQPHEVAAMARGYNWSVLFMVSVPFLMIGTGAFLVTRAARRGLIPEL